jgi:hypothetical protein
VAFVWLSRDAMALTNRTDPRARMKMVITLTPKIRSGVMAIQLVSSSREDKPYQAGKQRNQAGIEQLEGSDWEVRTEHLD